MASILAVLGNESHTTSSRSAALKINAKPMTYQGALSKNWQSKFGDKHARWCECVFSVKDGDIIEFEAAHNYGPRACNQDRTNITLRFDSNVDVVDVPVAAGKLTGRLVIIADQNAADSAAHEAAKANL